MAERDEDVLKRYRLFIKDTEKTLGHKINPTTGGKSANHNVHLRKDKSGAGALDLGRYDSFKGKDSAENKRKVARLALRHGLRVGFEGHHLHVDDNLEQLTKKGKLVDRTFVIDREGKSQRKASTKIQQQVIKDHEKEIEARGKMMGLTDSQRTKMLLDAEKARKTDSNSATGASLVDIAEKPMSKKNRLISKAQEIVNMDEEEERRRRRFLAVQGGTAPPSTVTKVLGVERVGEANRLITEEVAAPGSIGRQVSDVPMGPPVPERRAGVDAVRPISEDNHIKAKVLEKSTEEAVEKSSQKQAIGEKMVMTQPDKVKDIVKGTKMLDPETEKEVMADITAKSKGGKRKGGAASQFTDALSFFLPNIIGALGGGLLGGTEGAIEGYEESKNLQDRYFDRESELASRQTKGVDYKTFVDSTTGKPVVQRGGRFFDLTGQEVDPSTVTQSVTFRQTRGLSQRQAEQEGVNTRFGKKFDLQKQKESQLTPAQVEADSGLSATIGALDSIEAIKKEVNTGPLASRLSSLAQLADLAPEKFTELQSAVKDMQNQYIKAITGAQMSEAEAQRIMAVAPDINDNDETFQLKLKAFKKIVTGRRKAILESIRSGQRLKQGTIDEMIKDAEETLSKIDRKSPKKQTRAKGNAITMTAEQKKRLEELRAKYRK